MHLSQHLSLLCKHVHVEVACLEFLSVSDMLSENEMHNAVTADRVSLICGAEPEVSSANFVLGNEYVFSVEKRYWLGPSLHAPNLNSCIGLYSKQ